jgi:2-C-methyl-D-erythritol 4-phosphate cytidylyltransferase
LKSEARIWALVPAAGSGKRMGTDLPKQYLPLLGRPVIVHTLQRLASHSRIQNLLIGLSANDTQWPLLVRQKSALAEVCETYTGGATRAETVLRGLNVLASKANKEDWVLVHDAVRPCLQNSDIDKLINAVTDCTDGALLGAAISDTVKRGDALGRIEQTVPRTGLWRALTPQLFPVQLLTFALAQAVENNEAITDEAMAVERLGKKPCVVAGRSDNIKITLPGDLALAELFIQQQAKEGA